MITDDVVETKPVANSFRQKLSKNITNMGAAAKSAFVTEFDNKEKLPSSDKRDTEHDMIDTAGAVTLKA